jgi:DNA-binding HxlR family transcriptional regulator
MSSSPAGATRVLRAVIPLRADSRPGPDAYAPTRAEDRPARPASPSVPASPPRPRTPIELTLEVLRGPLRPLVMWGLFWGPRPFSELMRHVPNVTKRALRRELVEMERIGLVVRDVRPDSNRRAFYSLSPFGETLRPVVGAMYEWGLLLHSGPRRD